MVLPSTGEACQQQVAHQDAPGRERQGYGHVHHRALGGGDPRLLEDLQPVRDGLDPVYVPAPREYERRNSTITAHSPRAPTSRVIGGVRLGDHLRRRPEVVEDPVPHEQNVRGDEDEEDRQQDLDRLLHALRLSTSRAARTAMSSGTLYECHASGRKLRSASMPEQIEIVMVSR